MDTMRIFGYPNLGHHSLHASSVTQVIIIIEFPVLDDLDVPVAGIQDQRQDITHGTKGLLWVSSGKNRPGEDRSRIDAQKSGA